MNSDGTSEKGHSYVTFDIVNDAGKTFVARLREVSSGDAESQLKILESILGDVCTIFVKQSDGNNQEDRAMSKILKSIQMVGQTDVLFKTSSITFSQITKKNSANSCQRMAVTVRRGKSKDVKS